jgi:two-component system, cell cycle response regulator
MQADSIWQPGTETQKGESDISILLIEDDVIVGQDLKEMLTDLGYRLAGWTSAGREAINLAEQLKPDLILMDVGLNGDIDGIEAATAIHERALVPIIFMTGYRDESTLHRAVLSGPAGYLVKPIDQVELRCAIEVAVHRHRAEVAMLEREIALQRTADLMESLSLIDELTSLKNRRAFFALAQQELKAARRDRRLLALLFIDVNELKPINDRHGHAVGDRALQETAQVLAMTSRESDIVARLGGDEFVVLARVSDSISADSLLHRLSENLEHSNARSNAPFVLDLSIGMVVVDPNSDDDITALLAKADAYMYQNKQARKQRHAESRGEGPLARFLTRVLRPLQRPSARKATGGAGI